MRFGGDQPEHVHRAERARRELADRRQRAREAFEDRWAGGRAEFGPGSGWAERLSDARDEAIDTAVRVRVTDETITAAAAAIAERGSSVPNYLTLKAALTAALAAAGFMVEE